MRTEVPKVRRCCFCVPLRRGLLFWGYLHLASAIFLSFVGFYFWWLLISFGASISEYATINALILIAIYSVIPSVLLVYGAHRKNYKIHKIQYYCAIVAEVALSITIIADASVSIHHWSNETHSTLFEWMYNNMWSNNSTAFIFFILLGVSYILFQLYVIVMVKNEVFKLRDVQQQFMFTNNAADAEANCILYLNSEAEGNKQQSNTRT